MFEGFVHPLIAWGALLASVPLIIHLLNRQRHQPMPWAAMRFMMAAYRRTRRRARLENLLLLLLRMAAIALLALALARPFTGADSPLAALTENRRDLVLVLDSSASTGYRESVQSVQEAIQDRARMILDELDTQRGDRVRLVVAAAQPKLLSARSPEDARAILATLGEPSDEPLDVSLLLGEIVTYAEEDSAGTDHSSLEVRILTDLQRRSYEPQISDAAAPGAEGVLLPPRVSAADGQTETEGPGAPRISASAAALDRLQALGVRVAIEDLGGTAMTPPNLGIDRVGPIGDVSSPGSTTEIAVRVRNHGAAPLAGIRVALTVDGERQPSRKVDVEARSTAQAVFRLAFSSSGDHALVGELEGDRLAVDDSRATVLTVPDPIRVLLVNGDPQREIDRDEVGYLRAVLEPPLEDDRLGFASSHSPFLVREEDALAFGSAEQDLSQLDVVVLANVSSPSKRVVTALEKWVADGGVLWFTLGDRTSDSSAIDALNARFWNATGSGLLPAKLYRTVEVPSRYDSYYRCSWFDSTHPGLSFFADETWRPFLTEVPIYAFVATEEAPKTTRVLARLDDEGRSPLLLERNFGRGRVLCWTTSIDRGWSRVADSPSTLIPLVHELLRYATSADDASRNVGVGGSMALEVKEFPRSPYVLQPDQSRIRLDTEAEEVARNRWLLSLPDLDRTGLWYLEHEEGRVPFAVELDPSEGDLDRLGAEELMRQHSNWLVLSSETAGDEDREDASTRGELWRPLILMTLIALMVETVWSAWIGRGRRQG